MLQKLRDQTQGTGFKILVGAIIVVLTLFGFGATGVFMGADPDMASVGGVGITQSQLNVETEREKRRILAQMGPEFDASSIDDLQLQQYVLQQMINRQVVALAADEAGIVTPPEQVDQELLQAPAYQVDGKFDEAIYRQQVQLMGYTPPQFVEAFGNALSSQQFRDGVSDTSLLQDWELQEMVRVVNQRRDLAYLPLTVEQFSGQVEVSEEEISLRYNDNASDYLTPLAVDVSYVSLSINDLLDDPSITVAEEEVASLYQEQRDAAMANEQRDSSHILIQVSDERSDERALELIIQVQSRLQAGETFEDLATSISEDPGSASAGGALGPAGQGIYDPAFEAALWALQNEGEISGPVRSEFGYHLIRLNGVIIPEYPSIEELRPDLELDVRRAKASDLFADQATALDEAAYEERSSLSGSAESLGLTVTTAERVSRSEPGADPLLANEAVLDALFSDVVLAGENSAAIPISDEQVAVVRVDAQYPPEPIPLADVSADIEAELKREKALAAVQAARARRTGAVAGGGRRD